MDTFVGSALNGSLTNNPLAARLKIPIRCDFPKPVAKSEQLCVLIEIIAEIKRWDLPKIDAAVISNQMQLVIAVFLRRFQFIRLDRKSTRLNSSHPSIS